MLATLLAVSLGRLWLPASLPPSTMPLILTDLPLPAFLSLKLPLAFDTVRLSPPTMPANDAPATFRLAAAVPSYTLLPAIRPLTPEIVALLISAMLLAVVLLRL